MTEIAAPILPSISLIIPILAFRRGHAGLFCFLAGAGLPLRRHRQRRLKFL